MNQIIGYIATLIVLSSFIFKDVKTLRQVNSIGCLLFVVYGFLQNDKPIIVTNTLIFLINLTNLIRHKKTN
jgi:uncharacterized protein with PQ loop repeat